MATLPERLFEFKHLLDRGCLASQHPRVWLIAGGLTILWALAIGAVRIARQPKNPSAASPTDQPGGESPAVASLVVNDFEVTRDAVPATVVDLAAREVISIQHVGRDHDILRVAATGSGRLEPYEAAVLQVLRSRARGSEVPIGALGTGPPRHARGWWRSFRLAVIRDAQARGLSRDLWDARTLSALTVVGMLPAPFVALASGDFRGGIVAAIGAAFVTGALRATHRQRHTDAGLAAGSRWLGYRRMLEDTHSIEDVPPSAVVILERRLAYATAMGLARTVLQTMPMGADRERRAWSSFGGTWRRVSIRYPRFWPPAWGWPPWTAALVGAACGLLGFLSLRLAMAIGWPAEDPQFPSIVVALRVFVGFLGVAGALVAAWAIAALIRGLLDLGAPRQITGQVLRIRKRGDGDRHYVAIDDGSTDVIRALRLVPATRTAGGVGEYDDAAAEVTPQLRYVRSIGPIEAPPSAP